MIAEYAQHNGHADLIRESVDAEPGSDQGLGLVGLPLGPAAW